MCNTFCPVLSRPGRLCRWTAWDGDGRPRQKPARLPSWDGTAGAEPYSALPWTWRHLHEAVRAVCAILACQLACALRRARGRAHVLLTQAEHPTPAHARTHVWPETNVWGASRLTAFLAAVRHWLALAALRAGLQAALSTRRYACAHRE
jgi:hypothetical protein